MKYNMTTIFIITLNIGSSSNKKRNYIPLLIMRIISIKGLLPTKSMLPPCTEATIIEVNYLYPFSLLVIVLKPPLVSSLRLLPVPMSGPPLVLTHNHVHHDDKSKQIDDSNCMTTFWSSYWEFRRGEIKILEEEERNFSGEESQQVFLT